MQTRLKGRHVKGRVGLRGVTHGSQISGFAFVWTNKFINLECNGEVSRKVSSAIRQKISLLGHTEISSFNRDNFIIPSKTPAINGTTAFVAYTNVNETRN